jgi:hypothetical protein
MVLMVLTVLKPLKVLTALKVLTVLQHNYRGASSQLY